HCFLAPEPPERGRTHRRRWIWGHVDRVPGLAYTRTTVLNQAQSSSSIVEGQQLEPSEVAQLIVEIASDKLASDIVMLDLQGLASFTDYFVIMSADSARQIQALEEDIAATLKAANLSLHRREGTAASGWVLMDYSDVIVHIFSPDERDFFGLERLWARAAQVVRIL
ncbi:MAG: ribosome silencing factor, partial [Chloroflexi bacterium]|nr:ribosome silencing factor [Chloroflexota bacterium]